MAYTLFAACRANKILTAKRVRLNASAQSDVTALFEQQESKFREGIVEEVPFDGTWKPDEGQIMTIELPDEGALFLDAVRANAISVDELDTNRFKEEGIRALFVGESVDEDTKVLVQRFTAQQVLSRRLALAFDANVFRRLAESAFTLDTALTCIVEHGKIKFKSQQKLRSIIDLTEIYREATDEEVSDFASHSKLMVSDTERFVTESDQVVRKLIHAITVDGILDVHEPADIQRAAQSTNLNLTVQSDRLVFPTRRAEVKELLEFLNECRFAGPLSGTPYVTNSRRAVR